MKDFILELARWFMDLDRRSKAAVIIAAIVGVILGTIAVATTYAAKGCSVAGAGTMILHGIMGLFITAATAAVAGLLLYGLLHIGELFRAAARSIERNRAFKQNWKRFEAEYGGNFGETWWEAWGIPVAIVGGAVVAIVGLSWTFGYIVWSLVC